MLAFSEAVRLHRQHLRARRRADKTVQWYGEQFAVPEPLETVFISWFQGGEVFRSGCCYYRGQGKIV